VKRFGLTISMITLTAAASSGCATMKSVFAVDPNAAKPKPISNPFAGYSREQHDPQNVVLRTKKGDRAIEVELPASDAGMSDFVIPVSPAFKDQISRDPASVGEPTIDESAKDRSPTLSDHEITKSFPQGLPEDQAKRHEIEQSMGLVPLEDSAPQASKSYLASVDHIKQLYKGARYEAALLEVDDLLRVYSTDPKLYQMRGTLLDRLGRLELAVQAWNQALRFDPSNQSLKRFVERKQQKASTGWN